jgi:hypothetical protein
MDEAMRSPGVELTIFDMTQNMNEPGVAVATSAIVPSLHPLGRMDETVMLVKSEIPTPWSARSMH